MNKEYHLTADGVEEIKKELVELIAGRSDISERIKTAREFGDLSENAEYSSVRQEQEQAEMRIGEIEHILKNVTVISQPKNQNSVELGNTVMLKGAKGNREFTIVGSVEANPLEGRISNESPIGKALLKQKLNAEVEIVTPAETAKYKITKIS